MLREPGRLITLQQRRQPRQVGLVQRTVAADGQAHAVDRQRPAFAHPFQVAQEGPAIDHVVLGVDLEEVHRCAAFQHLRDVTRLQAQAGQRRTAAPRPALDVERSIGSA